MDEYAIKAHLRDLRRQFPSLPMLRDFQVIFSNFQSQWQSILRWTFWSLRWMHRTRTIWWSPFLPGMGRPFPCCCSGICCLPVQTPWHTKILPFSGKRGCFREKEGAKGKSCLEEFSFLQVLDTLDTIYIRVEHVGNRVKAALQTCTAVLHCKYQICGIFMQMRIRAFWDTILVKFWLLESRKHFKEPGTPLQNFFHRIVFLKDGFP